MNNIFKISLILLIAVFFFSCEDLLVEDPPSSISLSSFYQSENDALAGLYSVYSIMYDIMGINPINYGELNADDLTVSPIVTDGIPWDEFTYNSDVTDALWLNCFSGINRANEVILYSDEIDMNAGTKADIIVEAKALRAFYYFKMVQTMGGVPLYETPTVGFDNIYAPRASEDEIYNVITRDLMDAADELESTSVAGRINANIANALLARVYLYRGDFSGALTYAQKVIGTQQYDLFPDYADIANPAKNNGIEHIWQLQYLAGEINNANPGRFGPRAIPGPYNYSFYSKYIVGGLYAPSAEFVAENPQSYRRSATITDRYEHIDGVTGIITMEEAYNGVFPYYIKKFDDRVGEIESSENQTILRYADILLIAAEAINETSPSDNLKYTWINLVRERARNGVETDLPDLAGLSQEQFRTAVLEERRFELAFEGQRSWDLKRRGLFLETMRAQGKTVEDYMLLFPIPDEQVKLNANLEQNIGW